MALRLSAPGGRERFLESDEVYLEVREREKTQAKEGLPPVVRFRGKDPPATKRSSKKPKIGKPT